MKFVPARIIMIRSREAHTCEDHHDGSGVDDEALAAVVAATTAQPAAEHPEQEEEHEHERHRDEDQSDDGQDATCHQPGCNKYTRKYHSSVLDL